MSPLPRTTPEAQGIPSAAISAFIDAVEHQVDAMHSFILVRHGVVVAEGWWTPYRPTDPHSLYSLSKSFTSTAVGLLIAEGRLSLDDPVIGFFPDETPADPSDNLKAMRVRHLLSMSTGHTAEPFSVMDQFPDNTWVELFLMHPVEHAPGTYFLYNSHASYMLSAIVQKITGGRMLKYLKPRLLDPLGIRGAKWERSPQGIDTGGWGLSITTRDIAAFGQLYLQKGLWQGKRLLPESWVEAATSFQISNGTDPNSDWAQGYGYQFWRCRHNAYRGDGAFGQYCIVMPDQEAVLAINSGLGDMQVPMTLVWEHLLLAMQDKPLPADPAAAQALTRKLDSLCLRTVEGARTSPLAGEYSGRVFKLGRNPDRIKTLRFDFSANDVILTLSRAQGEQRIACGYGEWLRSAAGVPPIDGSLRFGDGRDFKPWQIAASGAWIDERTFVAKLWWYETPLAATLTCRFDGDQVTVEQRGNYGFYPTEGPTLNGTLS